MIRIPSNRCLLLFLSVILFGSRLWADDLARAKDIQPRFRVLVLTESGGVHAPFVEAARTWLKTQEQRENFCTEWIETTAPVTETSLARYQVIVQLNYPPYGWMPEAAAAFREYIEKGKGGWIGFHHATLLGEFDGYPLWSWFSTFMGGIRYKNYIASFATASVHVEDVTHPCMKHLPADFSVSQEEWYTYDRSPRANVRVLASVDEKTYVPKSTITMGDHPVVWTNEHVAARNVYIFMGHRAEHFQNSAFTTLFHDALLWAAHCENPEN